MTRRVANSTVVLVAGLLAFAAPTLGATPTVGALSVQPGYIVVNTPTQVTFSISITNSSLLANSVNLLQIDAAGKTTATIGLMQDDGLNGDAVAGDRVFSYRTTITQPSVGTVYWRASAAFKGVLQRVTSNIASETVDPVQLPPDPGDAGTATLQGIDADGDGVRDDIQRYIAYTFFGSPKTQATLLQDAVALQLIIIAGDNVDSASDAWKKAVASLQCLTYTFGAVAARRLDASLERRFLNTDPRMRAYYRSARHPSAPDVQSELSEPSRNPKMYCVVDPDNFPQ